MDFKSYYCLQSGIYSYTIWKKELKETQDPLLYFETINLNGPEELPLEIQVVCESRLKKEKDMPIIFYCTSRN